jgi:predicted nucleic acid-binding protein
MPYLIDSAWVIDHLAADPAAQDLLGRLAGEGIAVSVVTYMEAHEGCLRSPSPRTALERLGAFVSAVPILPFGPQVAERCSALRAELRVRGRRVNNRALDLIVAATALHHGLTLVTRNVRDYRDIPGLDVFRAA